MRTQLRVALVHDYLNEFGGAERVLLSLSKMYSDAPIYTAFYKKNSLAHRRFSRKKIISSWVQRVPGFVSKLHSPLRFLAPLIWSSFDFSQFDLVISSASWYITKGIMVSPKAVHISYIHTPPRYLYGYQTSIEWQKHWLVRQYARIVNHFLRIYDFESAQKPDLLVVNSHNVLGRVRKFYRREAVVLHPSVELPVIELARKDDYYLVISRIVGGKGISLAVQAANELKVPLKVVGVGAGWGSEEEKLRSIAGSTVEFLGHVNDEDLARLYAGAKAFLALAQDEDFGITPVEAMGAGTPVIAYKGGGYVETVVDGKTGVFFDDLTVEALVKAMQRLEDLHISESECKKQAQKFSFEHFSHAMRELVDKELAKKKKLRGDYARIA